MMADCYILAETLSNRQVLVAKTDGKETNVLTLSLDDLASLSQSHSMIAVISSKYASLFKTELPSLSAAKQQQIIPFALEDKLAQPIEHLHMATSKAFYHNQHYLVVVIEKKWLEELIALMSSHGIQLKGLTLDWFALNPDECLTFNHQTLIHSEHLNGYLWPNMQKLLKQPLSELTQTVCEPSELLIRISQKPYINLLQGQFEPKSKTTLNQKIPYILGAITLCWFLVFIIGNMLQLHWIHQQEAKIDDEIKVIYKLFFPEATTVISPRFRINQVLSNQQQGSQAFWDLTQKLGKSIPKNPSYLTRMSYQNNSLQVNLTVPDFDVLDKIKSNMAQNGLSVRQIQANTDKGQVVAVLELK